MDISGTTESVSKSTEIYSIQKPSLIISEIFYDGSDEWIELTNLQSSPFSGEIFLSGGVAQSLLLSIPANQSILFVKPSANYSRIDAQVSKISSIKPFSFIDTKAIDITLWCNGIQLDSFSVDTGLVNQLNDKKISFQKIFHEGNWIVTGTKIAINVLS